MAEKIGKNWARMFVDNSIQDRNLVKKLQQAGFCITTMPRSYLEKPEALHLEIAYTGKERIQQLIDMGTEEATRQYHERESELAQKSQISQ